MDSVTKTYNFQNCELPLEERVEDLISHLTLEEKINLMCQYQVEIPRLGIRKYKHGTEVAHGVAWLGEATVFPQNIGLGCTWDEELMKEVGSAIADEARVYYQKEPEINGLTVWAPTVDMERDPRWGRTEEAYGEDPHLTGKLTTELIKGLQGEDETYLKTAATLKHFLGNNNEVDRGECSVSIDPRNMNEYYLKAFERQIKEGNAQSIMTAYNAVNGTLCNMNPAVNDILKKEWGMDGFVVSDAGDVLGSVNEHKYVESYAEAVALSIKNGVDSITDNQEVSLRAINDALEQGLLEEADLDQALKNTFRVRFRLGEFDPDEQNPFANINEDKLCSPEHSKLSLQAARKSIVLLKNEQSTLPLKSNKVAVIGTLANEVFTDWYSGTPPYKVTPVQGISKKVSEQILFADGCDRIRLRSASTGKYVQVDETTHFVKVGEAIDGAQDTFIHKNWGWGSVTLQSEHNQKYVTVEDNGNLSATALEAKGWFVKEVFGMQEKSNQQVHLTSWDQQPIGLNKNESVTVLDKEADYFVKEVVESGIEKAVEAAKQAETAILFVGNSPFINGKECIDRPNLNLPSDQEKLIQEVLKVNPNTVVVIVGSYPFSINWVKQHVPAVIYTSHGGQEHGQAIADVLFGDYNPAGRLNMTWYQSAAQLADFMDYDIIKGKRTYQYFDDVVLYPFGHGLSYSSFLYENLVISEIDREKLNISATVTNTSEVDGEEVVQLYVRCDISRVKRPLKTLKGFKRVFIKKGQSKVVTFEIRKDELAIWDVTRETFCVEKGTYTLMVGSSSEAIKLEKQVEIDGDIIPLRKVNELVKAINYDDYHAVYLDECKDGLTGSIHASIRSKKDTSWISLHEVSWDNSYQSFIARIANGGEKTLLEIRANDLDGPVICECEVPKTGGYQAWTTIHFPINQGLEVDKLYIRFKGEIQLSWFKFV
ncbi:glycoside hydrolase family 3 C-terminal domain-containing protein [Metabacillus malikii]|uniref:Beta-glucosidase n=1 Tax=Metabacillus malikii TaxID=1504265 RepID=A0ABT9ZEN9_9BACI|nr:glycoside hydrolase family 3 C-terminal domain-containing protein [Metabacillus malikii]MDQ0230742.1 beta-glucosidase [Metabacillus malikii]